MTTVAFIVNGDQQSAMGQRANAFAGLLRNRYDIRIAYRLGRKFLSLLRFIIFLARTKPQLVYVFDMSYSGTLAALVYKWVLGCCLIIDTGDAIYELARSMGRGAIGLWLTRLLENVSFISADRIVVRGTFYQRMLSEIGIEAALINDGADTTRFAPRNTDHLRKRNGLDQALTIGVMGSCIWSEKRRTCYGWELVETINLLQSASVKGIIIGAGSGIPRLKQRCKEYGIEDRVLFFGHVAYDDLPSHLNLIDVCLSTQTNDVVGQVRTTGKLPLYMATGRYVLASRVGEATLVLDEDMLVEYEGINDSAYPQRLADRISALLESPEKLKRGLENVAVAQSQFDYCVLAEKMDVLFATVLQDRSKGKKQLVSKADAG
jgi:glycosyltransferase involved in cell wall biosynthesis